MMLGCGLLLCGAEIVVSAYVLFLWGLRRGRSLSEQGFEPCHKLVGLLGGENQRRKQAEHIGT